jgi:hypothetical protein
MNTNRRTDERLLIPSTILEPLRGRGVPVPGQIVHKLTDVLFPATPPKVKNARIVRGIHI